MDAAVVTDGQLLGVDVVTAASLGAARPVVGQQESMQQRLLGQLQEVRVRDGTGEVASHLPQNQALIVVLKALEARQMVKGKDSQDLAVT
ncbi:hypothetical protein ACFSKU_12265 [Pontibacter silvestris]|uniref:Uncharacterized protein n=1 Tax=Pontibacter silvestris TaxID=2305183 RepID=A0ABW4WZ51_9BACT|nr:hypothetical protein [Pontibacter silvestris]MCC9135206.1 hypothetical protein [Pontibacter silvestris]